jgi:hypothetical protein
MTLYRRTAATLFAEVDRDVVALQADRGFCFGMEEVTAEVWRLLAEPADADALCRQLMTIYEVDPATCRAEVGALLDQMETEGLIEAVAG